MKRNILSLAIVVSILFAYGCEPTGISPVAEMSNPKDSLSYAYGVALAEQLKRQNEDLNVDIVAAAVREALSDKAQLTMDQCMEVIQSSAERKGDAAAEEGRAFLDENASKEGVQVTASGLQYRHIVEGAGNSPAATSRVTVHYKLSSTDGVVIQDSHDNGAPYTTGLNQVIPAWTEGVQLMKEGGSMELVVPAELGYGARGSGTIPPNATLIFIIDLIAIETE